MAEDTDQDFNLDDLGAAVPALDPRRPKVYSDEDNLTYAAPQSFSLPMRPQNANKTQETKAAKPQTPPNNHADPQKSSSLSDSGKVPDLLYDPDDPDALYDYTPDEPDESAETAREESEENNDTDDPDALFHYTADEPEDSAENAREGAEEDTLYDLHDYSDDEPVPELKYDDAPTDIDLLLHHVETNTGIYDPDIPFSPMQSEGSDSNWTISGQTISGDPPSPTPSEMEASLSGWPLVNLEIVDEFIHPATGVLTYAMRALDEDYDHVGWDSVYAFWIPADMAPLVAIEVWEARGRVPVQSDNADDYAVDDRDGDMNMDQPEHSEWDDGFEVAGAPIEEGDFVLSEYEGESEGKYVLPEAEQAEHVAASPEEDEEEDVIE